MKKEFKDYESINKSTKAPRATFLKNLKDYYGSLTKLEIKNESFNNFYIASEIVFDYEQQFKKLMQKALPLRESNFSDYLSSGYIVSEINSSLKAEGVHSSRKITEQVLKDLKENKNRNLDEVRQLIVNYYRALIFILENPEINEKNLFTLYTHLTSGILEGTIEDKQWYRQGIVSIGKDQGVDFDVVPSHIQSLINWVNSDEMQDHIHVKAIISHYVFENIHPYYDYNGRMGRLFHLWLLVKDSRQSFWELIFLSEAIYSFKQQFGTMFDKILKAKTNDANIDLTYVVCEMFEIFNKHTNAYIKMKDITSKFSNAPSRFLRLFIIDMLCIDPTLKRFFTINDFKKQFPDYSSSQYGKITKEIQNSNLFEIQISSPIKFRLKNFKFQVDKINQSL